MSYTIFDMQTEFDTYRREIEERERESLLPNAALSLNHSRYIKGDEDHRLPYKRDVDRIIHSKAYCRYVDKTQVVYLVDNDHITHRALHVQLVSNFARGIAEILRLNVDLVEAIAYGHDVGHPPFGHEGEEYLSELSQQFGEGPFSHPWQSCRLFREIEPLNLNLATYDGFLCHDGGMRETILKPRFHKTWDDHFIDLQEKKKNPDLNLAPATLEGCLVKLCDTMSYLGRDIDDAIRLKIIEKSEVPQTILGTENRKMLATIARDIIKHSQGQSYIALSDEIFDALKKIRNFNFNHIYMHPKLKAESGKVRRSYRILFGELLEDYREKGSESYLERFFVKTKTESYRKNTSDVQMTVDYIAGMTDHYFIKTVQNFLVPSPISF